MSVEERLNRLERATRRWQFIASLALVTLAIVALGRTGKPTVLQELVIEDDQGRRRIHLGTKGEAAFVDLYDAAGLLRMRSMTQGALTARRTSDSQAAAPGEGPASDDGAAKFLLFGQNGQRRIGLFTTAQDTARLTLYSPEGNPRLDAFTTAGWQREAMAALHDPDGKRRLAAYTGTAHSMVLNMYGPDELVRISNWTDTDGSAGTEYSRPDANGESVVIQTLP